MSRLVTVPAIMHIVSYSKLPVKHVKCQQVNSLLGLVSGALPKFARNTAMYRSEMKGEAPR